MIKTAQKLILKLGKKLNGDIKIIMTDQLRLNREAVKDLKNYYYCFWRPNKTWLGNGSSSGNEWWPIKIPEEWYLQPDEHPPGPDASLFFEYLERVEALSNLTAYAIGDIPTEKELKAITIAVGKLEGLLQDKFQWHYQNLYEELVKSRDISHRLRSLRENNPRVKITTAPHKVVVCKHLMDWWFHDHKEIITAKCDKRNSDIEDDTEFYELDNPGAFYLQKTLAIYFDLPLNNRQIEMLIDETKKESKAIPPRPIVFE